MSAGGGPPVSISFNGREFKYAADATPNVKLGGFENEYQPNGDGTSRLIKTRVSWMISGNKVEIDSANEDFEFLNDVQNSSDDVDVSVTYADGTTRVGSGNITGELAEDNSTATAAFDASGPGELKKV